MDKTTELLNSYAQRLTFEDLGAEVVHQVKRTLIDTLGCAMGGFSSRPAQIVRDLALRVSSTTPSRILGDRGLQLSGHGGLRQWGYATLPGL